MVRTLCAIAALALLAPPAFADEAETLRKEVDLLKAERDALTQKLREREAQALKLQAEAEAQKAKALTLAIENQALRERNEKLVEQLRALKPDPDRPLIPREPPTTPAKDIRGKVTAVAADGLARISVGSDAGVEVGNVLQVYRVTPAPSYLGTLKVTEVKPKEAVGRFTPANPRMLIQKDDDVASGILSRR